MIENILDLIQLKKDCAEFDQLFTSTIIKKLGDREKPIFANANGVMWIQHYLAKEGMNRDYAVGSKLTIYLNEIGGLIELSEGKLLDALVTCYANIDGNELKEILTLIFDLMEWELK